MHWIQKYPNYRDFDTKKNKTSTEKQKEIDTLLIM